MFVCGQSVALIFLNLEPAVFDAAVAAGAPGLTAPPRWGYAVGGSVASSTNALVSRTGRAPQFWWDMAADAPGPLLAKALEKVRLHRGAPAETMLWDLGQSEGVLARTAKGDEATRIPADYITAARCCLETLRAALRPKAPETLPVLFMPVGPMRPRAELDYAALARIRAAQHGLIDELPNCHCAGELATMDLRDVIHPSEAGARTYAEAAADTYVRLMRESRQAIA